MYIKISNFLETNIFSLLSITCNLYNFFYYIIIYPYTTLRVEIFAGKIWQILRFLPISAKLSSVPEIL